VPENAFAGARRQHDGSCNVAAVDESAVPQREEERLVLDDWSTITSGKLVIVCPIEWGGLPRASLRIDLSVVVPRIRVESGISDSPHAGSMKLIGAGPRHELKLSIATSQFCIDGSCDDAYLANQIRTHVCRALKTHSEAGSADVVHAITRDVDSAKTAQACNRPVVAGVIGEPDARNQPVYIQHVIGYRRQFRHAVLVDHLADRRTRRCQQSVYSNCHFNSRVDAAHTQCEI